MGKGLTFRYVNPTPRLLSADDGPGYECEMGSLDNSGVLHRSLDAVSEPVLHWSKHDVQMYVRWLFVSCEAEAFGICPSPITHFSFSVVSLTI